MKLSEALSKLSYVIVDEDNNYFVAKTYKRQKPKYEILKECVVPDMTPVAFTYKYLIYPDMFVDVNKQVVYRQVVGNLYVEERFYSKYKEAIEAWIDCEESLEPAILFRKDFLKATTWKELVEELSGKNWSFIIETAVKISQYLEYIDSESTDNEITILEVK